MNITQAFIWFLIAFLLVNGLKFLHTIVGSRMKHQRIKNNEIPVRGYYKQTYFGMLRFQPFYYVIIWLACSYFYFSGHISGNSFTDALITGIFWWALTVICVFLFLFFVNYTMYLILI